MSATVLLQVRDSVRLGVSAAPALGGVDLCATAAGLHRIYRVGAAIVTEHSFDAARSWPQSVLASDAASDSIPAIAAAGEALFAAYHDAGASRIYRSADHGLNWEIWKSVAGLKFPRLMFAEGRQYLAGAAGGSLHLYASRDSFQTFVTTETPGGLALLSFAATEQRPVLGIDRRRRRYLIYESGGNLLQRASPDGVDWSGAPTTLVSGRDKAASAYGPAAGLHLYWNSSVLSWQETESDYQALTGTAAAGPTVPRQCLGLAFDHADVAWLVAQQSGAVLRSFYRAGPSFREVA